MHTPPPGHREHGATTKKTQEQVRRLLSWAGVWRFPIALSRAIAGRIQSGICPILPSGDPMSQCKRAQWVMLLLLYAIAVIILSFS